MTFPLLDLTERCCRTLPEVTPRGSPGWNITDKIGVASVLFDIGFFVTTLAVGLIGTFSVITMPPTLSWSLLVLSGGTATLWISMVVLRLTCCKQA